MAWAFSTSESTSPMPRMRWASRSGWNGSSASVFSPTPTKAMGRPVTSRTDSAAPPRASPSILVRIDRVDADGGVELVGHRDRVLAGHGVHHQQDVVRPHRPLDGPQLLEHLLVDVQPPRGVEDERRQAPPRRLVARRRADVDRASGPASPTTGTPSCAPSVFSWSIAAGR